MIGINHRSIAQGLRFLAVLHSVGSNNLGGAASPGEFLAQILRHGFDDLLALPPGLFDKSIVHLQLQTGHPLVLSGLLDLLFLGKLLLLALFGLILPLLAFELLLLHFARFHLGLLLGLLGSLGFLLTFLLVFDLSLVNPRRTGGGSSALPVGVEDVAGTELASRQTFDEALDVGIEEGIRSLQKVGSRYNLALISRVAHLGLLLPHNGRKPGVLIRFSFLNVVEWVAEEGTQSCDPGLGQVSRCNLSLFLRNIKLPAQGLDLGPQFLFLLGLCLAVGVDFHCCVLGFRLAACFRTIYVLGRR